MIEFLSSIPPGIFALCNVALLLVLAAGVMIKEHIDSSKKKMR